MPAKKAPEPTTEPMSMDTVWRWVYAAGLVIAGLVGAFGLTSEILNLLLLVVAFACGLFYFPGEELGAFGVRVVAIWVAREGLSAIPFVPAVGTFFGGLFGGFLFFLYPVVLGMALQFLWKKRIATLFS